MKPFNKSFLISAVKFILLSLILIVGIPKLFSVVIDFTQTVSMLVAH